MVVEDLINQLKEYPQDAWLDAMFPDSADAFTVTGTDQFKLSDGRTVVIIDIVDAVPLKAV